MGGATAPCRRCGLSGLGLSPRGRGNPSRKRRPWHISRSIPAWAGQPLLRLRARPRSSVYPRVGGATGSLSIEIGRGVGLSPRGRGNRPDHGLQPGYPRSIPAWAGQPSPITAYPRTMAVYPRVGGATVSDHRIPSHYGGLSPRGRGNRSTPRQSAQTGRSIPAWAGQPGVVGLYRSPWEVYPRVGGATPRRVPPAPRNHGLSPRGRGNRTVVAKFATLGGSIPAWAGQPVAGGAGHPREQVYPRVGGATEWQLLQFHGGRGLSPRGRGNRMATTTVPWGSRSIPAWAGQPTGSRLTTGLSKVYPRVGGATGFRPDQAFYGGGLSPRGRGNPPSSLEAPLPRGSIPAWAGQPWQTGPSQPRKSVYPRVGGATEDWSPFLQEQVGLSPRGRGNLG